MLRLPTVPEFCNDLAGSHSHLADLLRTLGQPKEALDGYGRALAFREELTRTVKQTHSYRSDKACTLRRRGLARAALGDPVGAADDAQQALELLDGLASRSGEEWYETACCHAARVGLAGEPGSELSAGSGPAEADRAMEQLRRAIGMGYRNLGSFRTEAALGPLRDRPDFRLLMMDLAIPADPFARHD
jgi:eukaryotic-like serine/threonine-protein kinase